MKTYLLVFIAIFVIIVPIILYRSSSGLVGAGVYNVEEELFDELVISAECASLLRDLNVTVPVLLIDPQLLEQFDNATCANSTNPIIIGLDVTSKHQDLLGDPRFEVWFYTNDPKTDYLDFRTDLRKIIPKNFRTQWVANVAVPSNIPMFLGFWKRARFIECLNLTMPRNDTKVVLKPAPSTDALSVLRDELVAHGMFPFLNGGTLLGWYRECSVIPHTQDMDFAVFVDNFNPEYTETLKSHKSKFLLTRKLGMLNDSLELTVVPIEGGRFNIDIFMMYEEVVNGTINHWTSGLARDGTKYMYSHGHYNPWCSADLFGHIFWVTCSPKEKLVNEYGPLWYMDHPTDKFSWYSSQKNVKENGKFTKEQLKTAYQTYNVQGGS